MPLRQSYPADFEKVWQAYPDWPKGRSVKQAAFKKFRTLKRELKWTEQDISDLVDEIESQKRHRASWQRGDKFGPQGLQVWLNQHGWEHEYQRTKKSSFVPGVGKIEEVDRRPEWEKRGITKEAYEFQQEIAHAGAMAELKGSGILRRTRNET